MRSYGLLSVAVLLAIIASIDASCKIKEACFQGKRFYFEAHGKVNQEEATQSCAAMGMKLVSVDNCDKDAFIVQFIKEMECTHENFWTSGYQNGDKKWYWQGNGKPMIFTNWKTGEPNYKKNKENCVHYRFDYLQWNDEECHNKHLYICESNERC